MNIFRIFGRAEFSAPHIRALKAATGTEQSWFEEEMSDLLSPSMLRSKSHHGRAYSIRRINQIKRDLEAWLRTGPPYGCRPEKVTLQKTRLDFVNARIAELKEGKL